jgi:hypothetical protein
MSRKIFILAMSMSGLLAWAGQASAQDNNPNPARGPKVKVPRIEGQPPEVQKRFDIEQAEAQQRRFGKLNGDSFYWGGVRLRKTEANLQQLLGLDENEGLLVTSVDPNSAGDKAGLKPSDVLLKVKDKSVPNDADGFAILVRNQKADEAADLVVVRDGKEETLKAAKMPASVQINPIVGGGKPGRMDLDFPRVPFNPRLPNNPFQPAVITKLHVEMTVNGAKIIRKQDGDQFSGEYSKDDLKITMSGKIENGQPRPSEVTVTEGKETKKFANPKEVPAQHRLLMQQLLPTPPNGLLMFPPNPILQDFRGLR